MSESDLRLALDVAPVRAEPAGVGVYAASLARALGRFAPQRLTLLGVRDEAAVLDDLRSRVQSVPFSAAGRAARFAANYHAWLMLRADNDARRSGANLVHYTNAAAPLRSTLPYVVTVHDLSVLRFPHFHPALRIATVPVTLLAIARARSVIVPSDWVRGELIRGLRVAARRVVVVEHAPSDEAVPTGDSEALLERLGIGGRRYLLSVGTIEPRKNLARLVAAYERLAAEDPDLWLVLAGSPGWRRGSIERRIAASPHAARILVAGYKPTHEVAALMRRCAAFCYVSTYEGYGLPVIEALANGAPVVTSNRSAMPQAAGGAAVLVDPFDVADIARGIREAMERRAELSRAGPARAALRSWDDVAAGHMAVYDWVRSRG